MPKAFQVFFLKDFDFSLTGVDSQSPILGN
jgi:hypothetical protein